MFSTRIRTAVALLAMLSWLVPARRTCAQENPSQEKPALAVDVALSASGALRGVVVDAQGLPCADHVVAVHQNGRVVARARSGAEGRFEAPGLRGGSYLVVCRDAGIPCRLWSEKAAPPAANQELLVPASAEAARGQNRFRTLVRTVAIVAAVGAAIAVPIVLTTQEKERRHGS
jgi:hypothetical protein